MKTYLSVYLGSFILAIITTPLVTYIGRRLNFIDAPGIRKVHSLPIPRIGGVAIFASMIALIIPVMFLPNVIGVSFRFIKLKIVTILIATGFIFVFGLIDDIKGIRARTKFLAQLFCALTVCLAGVRIHSVSITDSLVINFGFLSWPVTILWIVGITNAVNIIDGLDGLAAGICAAACGVIAILTWQFGPPVMTVMMLCLLGSLTGFLLFNFNPAKIFMGDSGSLFLGFIIASSSVLCAAKTETVVGLALPVVALGIPIFDTLFSILRRFLESRSIFSADRSHFHHRLLALGFRHRHAVIAAYILTFAVTGLGMLMIFTRNDQTIILFISILVLHILIFRAVGSIKLKNTIQSLRRKRLISCRKKLELENFEKVELYFRQAEFFEQWWQAVCFAAEMMNFVRGSLPLRNRDGSIRILSWGEKRERPEEKNILKMCLPVSDRRADSSLKLEVHIQANDSVESAGRRGALFTQLIERYSIANLPNKENKKSPLKVASVH